MRANINIIMISLLTVLVLSFVTVTYYGIQIKQMIDSHREAFDEVFRRHWHSSVTIAFLASCFAVGSSASMLYLIEAHTNSFPSDQQSG